MDHRAFHSAACYQQGCQCLTCKNDYEKPIDQYGCCFDKKICSESCQFYIPEEETVREKFKIVIYEDGPGVVRAKFLCGKKVLDEGMAKCNPKDEYSFLEGARISLGRCKTLPCGIFTNRFVDETNIFIKAYNKFIDTIKESFNMES